jgi:hypothetical protein
MYTQAVPGSSKWKPRLRIRLNLAAIGRLADSPGLDFQAKDIQTLPGYFVW